MSLQAIQMALIGGFLIDLKRAGGTDRLWGGSRNIHCFSRGYTCFRVWIGGQALYYLNVRIGYRSWLRGSCFAIAKAFEDAHQ